MDQGTIPDDQAWTEVRRGRQVKAAAELIPSPIRHRFPDVDRLVHRRVAPRRPAARLAGKDFAMSLHVDTPARPGPAPAAPVRAPATPDAGRGARPVRPRATRPTSSSPRSSCSSRSSGSSRWLHLLGVAARLGARRRRTTVRRPRQLRQADHRRALLERAWSTRSASSSCRPSRSCCSPWCWPTCSTSASACRPSSGWACCCRSSPRSPPSPSSSPCSSARDFGLINWLLSLVGVDADRLAGRAVVLVDRRSPRWSTGAGPATTP